MTSHNNIQIHTQHTIMYFNPIKWSRSWESHVWYILNFTCAARRSFSTLFQTHISNQSSSHFIETNFVLFYLIRNSITMWRDICLTRILFSSLFIYRIRMCIFTGIWYDIQNATKSVMGDFKKFSFFIAAVKKWTLTINIISATQTYQ